jgi:transcriptional regulator with XRE-family HTH domain
MRRMDVSLLIRQRLTELGLDQRDLAAATQVTESYVSQLLTRRKVPPAPGRTDIYEKIGQFLKLPAGELSKLAHLQRQAELKKRVTERPGALFEECRELILRKCAPDREKEVRRIFEKEPFGELERLVTQKLIEVAGGLNMSLENCVTFLDPIIHSWDIDLKTFGMEMVLTGGECKRLEFVEQQPRPSVALQPGFQQFLNDKSLSGDATEEEIQFLRTLHFTDRRPAPLYYYRELQNLRDPLHFTHEN